MIAIRMMGFAVDYRLRGPLYCPRSSLATESNQLIALFAGLVGKIGLAAPQTEGCSAGIVGLSGLSFPWLLLLGTTFIYRMRKRS